MRRRGTRSGVEKHRVWGISTPPELAMRGGTPRGALDIYIPPPPLEAWGGAAQNKRGANSMQVRVGGWVGSRLELSLTCSSSRRSRNVDAEDVSRHLRGRGGRDAEESSHSPPSSRDECSACVRAQNTSGKGAESTCETIRATESAGRTTCRMGVAGAPFVAAAVIEILEDPRR